MPNAGVSLFWFVAVVVLIPLVLWLVKRGAALGGAPAGGMMRTVSVLPLSPGQRLVTVEVGSGEERRWLVLGVTAQSIRTLHSMVPQAAPPAVGAAPGGFAQLLGRLRPDADHGERDGR